MWQYDDKKCLWHADGLHLELDPVLGLIGVQVPSRQMTLRQLLGVEIISTEELGSCPLIHAGEQPEIVVRGDIVMATYGPTPGRPVECHARWRVDAKHSTFDLEVSALTPGKWRGLAVRTRSVLGDGEIQRLADVPLLIVHRPKEAGVSYIELCHPHDGIEVELDGKGVRFQLFGHDLEKGVILRGRVRGMIVPREGDEHAARQAFERFVKEPPHLSA